MGIDTLDEDDAVGVEGDVGDVEGG